MRIAALALVAGCFSSTSDTPDAAPLPTCATQQLFPPGLSPLGLVTADVDGDGVDEIIQTGAVSHLLRVDGTRTVLQLGTKLSHVFVGDVNGDKHLDIVTFSQGGDVRLLVGDGTGAFTMGFLPVAVGGSDLAMGDVDGDGIADLIAIQGNNIIAFLGPNQTTGPTAPANGATWLAAGDLDNDGRADLVVGTYGNDCFFQDNCTPVPGTLFSRLTTAGGFADPVPIQLGDAQNISGAQLVDLDGDGHRDLVGFGLFSFTRWANRGDGTFGVPTLAIGAAGSVAIADLDGDGVPEIVSAANDVLVTHGLSPDFTYYGLIGSAVAAGRFGGVHPQLVVEDNQQAIALVEPGCPH